MWEIACRSLGLPEIIDHADYKTGANAPRTATRSIR